MNPLYNKERRQVGVAKIRGDYYYEYLNRKVMLTEIGVYILDFLNSESGLDFLFYRLLSLVYRK